MINLINEKVYLVGSHSTGKTTLCRYIQKTYQIPIITEVARKVLVEMETDFQSLRTNIELVNKYQTKVLERQIKEEDKLGNVFVSDRSFDNVAYAAEHTTLGGDLINGPLFRNYMEKVSSGIVFFLRPHKELLKQDGVRENLDWDGVVRIDGMVKLLLEQFDVNYMPINSLSMQERIKIVDFVLKGKLYNE